MLIPSHISEEKKEAFIEASRGKTNFVFEGVQYHFAEGLSRRARARAASAAGTVKGALSAAQGLGLVAKGTLTRNKKTVERGSDKIRKASLEGKLAKIRSLKKSSIDELKKTTDDIANDMRKLNVVWESSDGDTSPQEMFSDVFKTFIASTEEIFNEIEYEIKQAAK